MVSSRFVFQKKKGFYCVLLHLLTFHEGRNHVVHCANVAEDVVAVVAVPGELLRKVLNVINVDGTHNLFGKVL